MLLLIQSRFLHQERRSNKELLLAFHKSHRKHTITPQDLQLIHLCSALDLCCANHFARIRWSGAFCKEFEDFFGLSDQNQFPDQPSFFVTLTDVSCTTNHDASSVEITKFKRKLQAVLRACTMLG
jgi:hypothetical protein